MEQNNTIRAKRILWHDPKINNSENLNYFQTKLNSPSLELERFSDYQLAVNFLSDSQGKWIVITSGSKARQFLPLIRNMSNIVGRIIFCSDVSLHQSWSQGLVDSVENEIDKVCEKVNSIYDNLLFNSTLSTIPNDSTIGQIHQTFIETTTGNETIIEEPTTSSFLLHNEIDNKKFLAIVSIFLRYNEVTPEKISIELVNMNTQESSQILNIFNQKKNDLLETIIYLYTTNFIYKKMNQICSEQNYRKLKFVLSCCLMEIRKRPQVMVAKNVVLYRGLRNRNHISKYLQQNKGYWPSFTSTSTNLQVALGFAQSSGIVFEIRLSNVNPHPHLKVPSNWSQFPTEDEVLLLPHFSLKVISSEEKLGRLWVKLEQNECDHAFSIDKNKFKEFWDKEVDDILGIKAEQMINDITIKANENLNAIGIFSDFTFSLRWRDRLTGLMGNLSLQQFVETKKATIVNEFNNFFQSYFRAQVLRAIHQINSLNNFDYFIKEYTCELERFMYDNMSFFDRTLKTFGEEFVERIKLSECENLELIHFFLNEIVELHFASFAEECILFQEKINQVLNQRKSQHIQLIKRFLVDKLLYENSN